MYSLIIGLSPSKGARSPKLWNRAYKKFKIGCEMRPLDIANEDQLIAIFKELIDDDKFQGGSITFPYKEKVANLLQKSLIDQATSRLGAINSLYRDEKGTLYGANTDGIAAVNCLEEKFFSNSIMPEKILVLGLGGVGKAVIAFINNNLMDTYPDLKLFGSSRKKDVNFLQKFNKINYVHWNDRHEYVNEGTLLINCTSLGDYQNINSSPISFNKISKDNLPFGLFDVIHTPKDTLLTRWAQDNKLVYSNGVEMNLKQAAIAFKLSTKINVSLEEIEKNMVSI